MQILRILSDIHFEKQNIFEISPLPSDSNTILILIGDIGNFIKISTYIPFLKKCSEQFKKIIYIPGNNEYYGLDINNGLDYGKNQIKENNLSNVYLLDNESLLIDDITFICSTLWTNFNNKNSISIVSAFDLNDYKNNITIDKKCLKPINVVDLYNKSINYIEKELSKPGKKILLTHYGISHLAIHKKFKDSIYNDAYVNNLDHMIIKYQPEYCFHGHLHYSVNYMIKKTNIVCNPFYQNDQFDPYLMRTL